MTPPERASRRGGVGCLAMPLLFFALVGAGLWGWDAVRLLRGRPVPAIVEASGITSVPGSRGGRTWAPDVRFRYTVSAGTYTAARVLPGGESRGEGWATALAARFPVGAQVTAYVDPDAPDHAFLLRRPSAGTYMLVVAPLLLLLLITAQVRGATHAGAPRPAPVPDDRGRWTLATESPAAAAERRAAAARIGWIGSAALLVPYLVVALLCAAGERDVGRTLDALSGATVGDGFFVFELLAVGGAMWVQARRARTARAVARSVRRVSVAVDRSPVRVDEPFAVTVDVALARDARLARLLVGLRRDTMLPGRNANADRSVAWAALVGPPKPSTPANPGTAAQRAPDAGREHVDARDAGIVGVARFRVPSGVSPSSVDSDVRPLTRWALIVRLTFDGTGDWDVDVPVRVHDAPAP